MKYIDQHSAVVSMEKALLPSTNLIDGRTERDRLSFLTEFASVINFYNNENKIHGNWVPFLLKDPVFLLAQISTTNFSNIHGNYKNVCHKLEQILIDKAEENDLSVSMNQLLDQITHVFMRIERWTHNMQSSSERYELKEYVINQVSLKYSAMFWAVLSLRENLVHTKTIPYITPVKYYLFEAYDDIIWKQNRGLSPFWSILNIPVIVEDDKRNPIINPSQCYKALTNAANELFNFFYTVIQSSNNEFENQKTKTSQYPDTVLIRTFVNLLSIHQEQLNGVAKKHLDFYFKDILKQKRNPARADHAFICAELSKPTATYDLQSGVLFNAGLDAQKKPILFETIGNVELNPASIANVYTLATVPAENNLVSLCLNQIPNPGVVSKDVAGNITGWQTFGGKPTLQSVTPSLAFAVASPLLLLREGNRKIIIRLGYDANKGGLISKPMLSKASYFLSTQKGWINLSPGTPIVTDKDNGKTLYEVDINPEIELDLQFESTADVEINVQENKSTDVEANLKFAADTNLDIDINIRNPFTIVLNLDNTHPAIENFVVNPDGLESDWPMFKIVFPVLSDPKSPPLLTSITIDVAVSKVKNLQLYNDNGALSTKNPYQLFGPTPLINSNFIIGSNEVFTKPLTKLSVELNWDKLPDSFSSYYQQYNVYLKNQGSFVVTPQENKEKPVKPAKSMFSRFFRYIIDKVKLSLKVAVKIVTLNWKNSDTSETNSTENLQTDKPDDSAGFNDQCFKVNFQALKDYSWIGFNTQVNQEYSNEDNLFNSPLNPDKGNAKRVFVYSFDRKEATPFPCNPIIQNTPLKYTDTSSDSFIKMELTGPQLGFGSGIYPNVVSYYALANAYNISHSKNLGFQPILLCDKKQTDTSKFVICPPPNPPFAPKISGLNLSYKASCTYILGSERKGIKVNPDKEIYPLQCFSYSVFNNYKVYDNTKPKDSYINKYLTSIVGEDKISDGVPLFSSFNDEGALFMELDKLLPTEKLNLYFELKRTSDSSGTKPKIKHYYLGASGWTKMDVISDSTSKLTCSGIVTVSVPDDVSNTDILMGNNQRYWLAFTTKDKLESFAQTLFLKVNGFMVKRTGDTFLNNYEAPLLPANSIVKPQNPLPEIASVNQAFGSFDGKGAENVLQMNQRVSNRLKTKDRAVSREDYYRIIKENFSDIYYSKSVYNSHTKKVEVYLVQEFENALQAGAFIPIVSKCKEEKIEKYLKDRTSSFCYLETSTFEFQEVEVTAVINLKSGYEKVGMEKKINDALNLFLSPWIRSTTKQVIIDQEITAPQTAEFLQNIEGVNSVQCVGFTLPGITGAESKNLGFDEKQLSVKKISQSEKDLYKDLLQWVTPSSQKTLMVSCMNHKITCINNN